MNAHVAGPATVMSAIGTIRLLEVEQSMSALPGISDINLFRYCEGINGSRFVLGRFDRCRAISA
jgi:hypothetical protein